MLTGSARSWWEITWTKSCFRKNTITAVSSQASEKNFRKSTDSRHPSLAKKTKFLYTVYIQIEIRRGLLMYEILKYVIDIAFVVVVAIAVISAIRKKKKKDGE